MTYLSKIKMQDGAGNDLSSTLLGGKQSIDVHNVLSNDLNGTGTLTALNSAVVVTTNQGHASLVFQLLGTWVGTASFQGSIDGGVTWAAIDGVSIIDDGTVDKTTVNGLYFIPCGGFPLVRVIFTAYTSGTANVTWNLGFGPHHIEISNTPKSPIYTSDIGGTKTTYTAGIVGLVAAATPTDIFTISGSATKVIRITRIAFSATQTTSANRDVLVVKRSALNTGGTSIVQAMVPLDSLNPAATAVVRSYTANPTALGALIGVVRNRKVFVSTTTTNADEIVLEFGALSTQSIVLRGATELVAINLNSITSTGNLIDINIEWTEENP